MVTWTFKLIPNEFKRTMNVLAPIPFTAGITHP